ncbi:MAG: hypothetical protein RL344_687 [Pseudomonadota bacterium]|jgi:type I restriction enzyme S subunit
MNTTNNKILSSLNSENPDSDNIPQLRFPEFEGEWGKKKLGEVTNIYDGTHQTPNYVQQGIPFYSVEQLTANDFNKTKFVSKEVFEKENKRVKLEKGDILMTRIGDIGTSRYIDWDVNASFYVSIVLIKQSLKFNSKFIHHFIGTKFFQNELWNRTIHVAFPKKINLGEIGNCIIQLPYVAEQTKIASFLTAVDEKIQALKKKKSLLENYKKGVMQKLFSQELRFKDDGEEFADWEVKKLGEVAKITTGSSNRQDSSLIGEFTFFDRSQDIRTSDRYLFDGEAIIVPGEGQEFIPKYFIGKFDLHQRTYAIMDFINANGLFLFYSISFNTNHLNSQAVGSTVKSLRLPMFETMPINLPCLTEQTKIANFLSAIDEKINHTATQIEKTRAWKKGLLQKMFV